MAMLNLSLTGGTKLASWMGEAPDFGQIYLMAGVVQVGFLMLIRWIDVSETRRVLGDQDTDASPLSPVPK